MGNTAFRLLLSRKSNIPKKRLTILTPRKSEIGKNRFPTAFLACFSVILSRKMKIADFRLTFSKKEFQNGAKSKSHPAKSPDTTYLAFCVVLRSAGMPSRGKTRIRSYPAVAARIRSHPAVAAKAQISPRSMPYFAQILVNSSLCPKKERTLARVCVPLAISPVQ